MEEKKESRFRKHVKDIGVAVGIVTILGLTHFGSYHSGMNDGFKKNCPEETEIEEVYKRKLSSEIFIDDYIETTKEIISDKLRQSLRCAAGNDGILDYQELTSFYLRNQMMINPNWIKEVTSQIEYKRKTKNQNNVPIYFPIPSIENLEKTIKSYQDEGFCK